MPTSVRRRKWQSLGMRIESKIFYAFLREHKPETE